MAVFSPQVTIETVNKCNDLKITDNSDFLSPLTKDVFTSRNVVITDSKGVSSGHNFPIGNSLSDILVIPNFNVGKDYYITVRIVYIFDNEGVSSTQELVVNHISSCNALQGRSKLLDLDLESCNVDILKLVRIDTSMENAIHAATYKLGEISQAFLDQSLRLIKAANK